MTCSEEQVQHVDEEKGKVKRGKRKDISIRAHSSSGEG